MLAHLQQLLLLLRYTYGVKGVHFDIPGVRYLDQWQRAPGSRGTSVLTNEGSFWAAWLVRRRGFIDVVGRSVGGRWPSVYRKPRMFF